MDSLHVAVQVHDTDTDDMYMTSSFTVDLGWSVQGKQHTSLPRPSAPPGHRQHAGHCSITFSQCIPSLQRFCLGFAFFSSDVMDNLKSSHLRRDYEACVNQCPSRTEMTPSKDEGDLSGRLSRKGRTGWRRPASHGKAQRSVTSRTLTLILTPTLTLALTLPESPAGSPGQNSACLQGRSPGEGAGQETLNLSHSHPPSAHNQPKVRGRRDPGDNGPDGWSGENSAPRGRQ